MQLSGNLIENPRGIALQNGLLSSPSIVVCVGADFDDGALGHFCRNLISDDLISKPLFAFGANNGSLTNHRYEQLPFQFRERHPTTAILLSSHYTCESTPPYCI
jgi:hypothetical protein